MIAQPESGGQSFDAEDLARIHLERALADAKATDAGTALLERIAEARKTALLAAAELVDCRAKLGHLIGDTAARSVFDSIKAKQ